MQVTRLITQGPRRPCNNYAVIVSCERGRMQILSIQSKCFTMSMHCSVNECCDSFWWERLVGKDLLGALSSHRVFTLLKTGLPDPWRIPSWVVHIRASLEIRRESRQDHALQYSLLWSCHPCCPRGNPPTLTQQNWILPAVVIFLILYLILVLFFHYPSCSMLLCWQTRVQNHTCEYILSKWLESQISFYRMLSKKTWKS